MVNKVFSNPLKLIRQEKAQGHIPAKLAAKAEALVEQVQKEAFKASSLTNANGECNIRPYWGTSAAQTKIKLDPEHKPTASKPLQGVSEFLDSYSVYGKWGYDLEKRYQADDKKAVFSQTDQSVRGFSVTINANGTLTIDPGEEIPVICTAGFD